VPDVILSWSLLITGVMFVIAISMVTLRLLRGPSLSDRVVALDLIGTLAAGAVGVYAITQDEPIYIFVSIVLALVLFVGTVAFAYHLEKGGER
jgi:multicomponent Na+:H+ antiporter subunit F